MSGTWTGCDECGSDVVEIVGSASVDTERWTMRCGNGHPYVPGMATTLLTIRLQGPFEPQMRDTSPDGNLQVRNEDRKAIEP